jgi:hypothetical protein
VWLLLQGEVRGSSETARNHPKKGLADSITFVRDVVVVVVLCWCSWLKVRCVGSPLRVHAPGVQTEHRHALPARRFGRRELRLAVCPLVHALFGGRSPSHALLQPLREPAAAGVGALCPFGSIGEELCDKALGEGVRSVPHFRPFNCSAVAAALAVAISSSSVARTVPRHFAETFPTLRRSFQANLSAQSRVRCG